MALLGAHFPHLSPHEAPPPPRPLHACTSAHNVTGGYLRVAARRRCGIGVQTPGHGLRGLGEEGRRWASALGRLQAVGGGRRCDPARNRRGPGKRGQGQSLGWSPSRDQHNHSGAVAVSSSAALSVTLQPPSNCSATSSSTAVECTGQWLLGTCHNAIHCLWALSMVDQRKKCRPSRTMRPTSDAESRPAGRLRMGIRQGCASPRGSVIWRTPPSPRAKPPPHPNPKTTFLLGAKKQNFE